MCDVITTKITKRDLGQPVFGGFAFRINVNVGGEQGRRRTSGFGGTLPLLVTLQYEYAV